MKEFKEGDKVAIIHYKAVNGPYIVPKSRYGKFKIASWEFHPNGSLCRKKGDRWSGFGLSLHHWTDEIEKKNADQNLRGKSLVVIYEAESKIGWRNISTEKLTRIAAILKEPTTTEGEG